MDADRTLSVAEAAKRLQITPDAVRHRVRRGTLTGFRQAGQWRVIVPPCPADDPPTTGPRTDENGTAAGPEDGTLAALQEQIEYLRGRLADAEAEKAELRRLISQEQSNVNRLLLQLPPPAAEAPKKRWWPWRG